MQTMGLKTESNTSMDVEKRFLEGQSWYEKNDFGEALKVFLELEAEDVRLAGVYFYLGLLYSDKFCDVEKAIGYYKKALEVDPKFAPTYYNYAYLLRTNNKLDELETFLVAMKQNVPSATAEVYFEYGLMREAQSRYKEAQEYYAHALQNAINPEFIKRIRDSDYRCAGKRRKTGLAGKIDSHPFTLVFVLTAGVFFFIFLGVYLGGSK